MLNLSTDAVSLFDESELQKIIDNMSAESAKKKGDKGKALVAQKPPSKP